MDYHTPPKMIPLIHELRQLNILQHEDDLNIEKVSQILKNWVNRSDWLEDYFYSVDTVKGFTSWLIFEEPDHSLAVNVVAWEPGREIVPHDHKTWSVVGCVVGVEKNYFWERLDDCSKPGFAEIKKQSKTLICYPGDIMTFTANDIHSVINISESVAISLHIYGKNLNFTNRCQYNPVTKTVEPFILNFK